MLMILLFHLTHDLLGRCIGFCISSNFFLIITKFHIIITSNSVKPNLFHIKFRGMTSFGPDCELTRHPPAPWTAFGSRLADARKHRRWHLTSSEYMSLF